MTNMIAVVGPSGSGKSTSFEKLDPNSTFIINVLGKPLPFKEGSKWSAESKNTVSTDSWATVAQLLKQLSTVDKFKTIVIDDAGFIMAGEFFKRAGEAGYNKFSEVGQHMFEVINAAKNLSGKTVIFTFHEELNIVEGFTPQRSIKTIGKMLSDKFTPEALFSVLLYANAEMSKDGEMQYRFITNSIPGYPAKSPKGMFDSTYIPNDLDFVIQKIGSYYEA